MQACDQIIHSKWIIPCEDANNTILENHALIINKGIIQAILPSAKVQEGFHASHIEHFSTHAILPGFINAHTHVPMNFFRGLADDLALMDWLNNHIWPAEKKWLDEEMVYDASLFAIAEMLRSGTTCFNDMFYFMPSTAKAVEAAGIRAHIGLHIITFATKWAKDAEEEFAKAEDFYENYKSHPLITPTLAAHSLYTITADKYLRRVRETAERYNLQINMHVQEPKNELEIVHKQAKMRPLQRLQAFGLLNPRLIAIHMLHVNPEDLTLLAAEKPHIVHCPESNMKLASGFCPVVELSRLGVNVALGTDGAASNNDLDMLGEMRSAAFLAKHEAQDPSSLPASQVLQMATLNGAKALRVDKHIGSLRVGKAADLIAINLEEIESLPLYHPISQIVYAASRHQVTDVWVAGKRLLKHRQLTTLDEKALIEKAKSWQERIKQQA